MTAETTPTHMYINGAWREAADGATIDVIDPATEAVVAAVPKATAADLDDALRAADAAWKTWREVDAWTRSARLRQVAGWIRERVSKIALVLSEEQGKTLPECEGEINAAADQFDWYADEARRIYGRLIDGHARDRRLLVIRQPIGPVAAFAPWNFPLLLCARKIAPAVAAGCSIIVAAPIETPRSALFLAQACHDAGLPPGVVNMVTGDPPALSKHLVPSPVIRKVSLTSSVPVGKEILRMAADGMKAVTMELGGHSPVLVFDDCDVEQAAETCALGKCRNNGQVCIAASRFYVQDNVAERFTERFVEVVKSMRLGVGKDANTDIGPLASLKRLEATEALIADATAKGATLHCGGKRAPGFDKGFFFEPAVLTDVDRSMRIMNEEPFCPVAPIATFTDLDDALEKANATDFGLAGYVFTNTTRTAFLASEGIEAGMVGVNTLLLATAEIPFGGLKQSGFGREGGSEGIEAYTVVKHINMQL